MNWDSCHCLKYWDQPVWHQQPQFELQQLIRTTRFMLTFHLFVCYVLCHTYIHWKKRLFPLNPSFNTLMFLLYLPPQEIQEVFKMITTRQHRRLNTMTTMTTMPPLTTTTVTAQEPHSIATVNNRSSTLQYWQPYLCFLCVFLVTMAHNATNSAEDNEVSATMTIPNEVQ